jgi:hypothetical protein
VAADASFSTNTVVANGPTCPLAPGGNGNQDDPPPADTPVVVPTPEAVDEPESDSQSDTQPDILGVSAEITKVLTSDNPAVVGELVTFGVALTLTGSATVEHVGIIETFEHAYLEYVSSSHDCVVLASAGDRTSLACEIGTVELGEDGEAGSETVIVNLTFRAVASTLPGATENVAEGLFGGSSIGPVSATVEIIEIAGLGLPAAGDGSTASSRPNATHAALVIAALLIGAAAIGVRARRTAIRTRLHK